MYVRRSAWFALVGLTTLTLAVGNGDGAYGQAGGGQPRQPSAVGAPVRQLAPGVLTTIKPDRELDDTFASHLEGAPPNDKVVEILRGGVPGLVWKPNFASATDLLAWKAAHADFRRPVWNLQFEFKPLRMMWVDMPTPDGKLTRKLVWYLVYRVKNVGQTLVPEKVAAEGAAPAQWKSGEAAPKDTYKISTTDQPEWFAPVFVLESGEVGKAYTDRVMPTVVPLIQKREDPNRKLLNSVEISSKKIPLSKGREDNSVWGVATWTDVDPTIDRFSIFVKGLSNAYRWQDRDERVTPLLKPSLPLKDAAGNPNFHPLSGERKLLQKALQLRFWRPGDEFSADESEIRFGSDPKKEEGKPDYEWVWR